MFTFSRGRLFTRLREAPQLLLFTRTMEAMRQKMLVEMANLMLPAPQIKGGGVFFTATRLVLGIAAAVTLIVVAGLKFTGDLQNDTTIETPVSQTHRSAIPSPSTTATNSPAISAHDICRLPVISAR